jgi:hypothetical protein
VFLPNSFTFSSGMVEGISGVQMGTGATAFTRTPCLAASAASPFVKVTIAPFVLA